MKNNKSSTSPFLTTSDVIHHLNKALSVPPEPGASESESAGESSLTTNTTTSTTPHFELQRRFANGQTRRATAGERKAADLESKLEQVASQISQLPLSQQWEWLHQQKQYGNELYAAAEYEPAIDVYLTAVMICLQHQASLTQKSREEGEKGEESDTNQPPSPLTTSNNHDLLFLQLMNNLAQSASQLSWYHKAIQFCNLASEQLLQKEPVKNFSEQPDVTFQCGKLYFKRGRAHRCRGEYDDATKALEQASEYLDDLLRVLEGGAEEQDSPSPLLPRVQTAQREIAKERQRVQKGVAEGQKNLKRQQRALQRELGRGPGRDAPNTASPKAREMPQPPPPPSNRSYSTLRSRRKPSPQLPDDNEDMDEEEEPYQVPADFISRATHYWNWYLTILGRLAQELLIWMGDEEEIEKRQQLEQAPAD